MHEIINQLGDTLRNRKTEVVVAVATGSAAALGVLALAGIGLLEGAMATGFALVGSFIGYGAVSIAKMESAMQKEFKKRIKATS